MTETIPPPEELPTRPRLNLAVVAFDIFLVILILTGVFFRFNRVNWNQDTDLHPDEYGLTGTLTQLSIPKNLSDYFNTRLSPISPYQKYDENGNPTAGGPDNRMRWGQWPLIIIRGTAETLNAIEQGFPRENDQTWNFTGYGEMRLLGRSLSALADTLSLIMIFLIGARLYGRRVGLLAAALSALAVMQIQQSHFMTVDNFAGFFTTVAMYGCVRIAQGAPVVRAAEQVDPNNPSTSSGQVAGAGGQANPYLPAWRALGWYALFGIGFGMALASKVNLLPLGGMILVAVFISVADVKLRSLDDLRRALAFGLLFLVVGLLVGGMTFRVTQPMSFRTSTLQLEPGGSGLLPDFSFTTAPGNTTLLTLTPNPDWFDSMEVASHESAGEGGGPPGEQWAHRTRVVFALVNMVMWGMGLALGLACWLAFGAAFWQMLLGHNWRAHLLPWFWAGGYFIFMGTRWVMSTRYFLPIYPFLCLLAAWGLLELWRWAQETQPFALWRRVFAGAAIAITVLGALAWASAFVQAVYNTPHTRIQAAHWIFQNIAGPIHVTLRDTQGNPVSEPLPVADAFAISSGFPYVQAFVAPVSGELAEVTLPHVQSDTPSTLRIAVASDLAESNVLADVLISIPPTKSQVKGKFKSGIQLTAGTTYYMIASAQGNATINLFQNTVANESWDEGLPMRFEGHDPFGGLYHGLTMEVRWPDDENKKQMFMDVIANTDYIIMPSQRAVWSTCRIPMTYPMTMDYYRALFDGRLGFDQVAAFSAPIKLGPLQVSDVGGTFAWNQTPALPLFNHSSLAAEEAFSVYDHPPVWIFKKRADFNIEQVRAVLSIADLSKAINQGPTSATGDWCPDK